MKKTTKVEKGMRVAERRYNQGVVVGVVVEVLADYGVAYIRDHRNVLVRAKLNDLVICR